MLVLTRRPGEAILIGESIEVRIIDADWRTLEACCAISIIDDQGHELQLRYATRRDGTAIIRIE
jgi:hypothetical protein